MTHESDYAVLTSSEGKRNWRHSSQNAVYCAQNDDFMRCSVMRTASRVYCWWSLNRKWAPGPVLCCRK